MAITHEHLWSIVKKLPQDYMPWGLVKRSGDAEEDEERAYYGDCSSGCKWFAKIAGEVGNDWGVCVNPASHRVGLLTFEHQGCVNGEKA